LHQVVRAHLETFLAEARLRGGGEGLPRFVERELREFLTCGVLARGFARFRCTDCQHEILVAFSCKGRGFCPSCCGRRMVELAAHLVDGVLGGLPVRQWVLTLRTDCATRSRGIIASAAPSWPCSSVPCLGTSDGAPRSGVFATAPAEP